MGGPLTFGRGGMNYRDRIGKLIAAREGRAVLVCALLGIVIAVAYLPAFQMGFVSDDFAYLKLVHFTAQDSLAQDNFGVWFADFAKWSLHDLTESSATLRPIRMWSMWGDYLAFGLEPLGYHFTSVVIHWGTSVLVYLIGLQLSRKESFSHKERVAILAGLLFAVLPIHSSDVSWVAARYHVLGGFLFALGFFFYLKAHRRRFHRLASVTFVLALFANEGTIAFPLAVTLYEIVYRQSARTFLSRDTARRLLLFWLIPLGYIALRFLLLGQFGGPLYARYDRLDLEYKVSGYVMYAVAPLLTDITWQQTLWLIAGILVVFLLYRSRRPVVLGILWMLSVLAVFIALPAEERYFYIPSIGLVLALAAILVDPIPRVARVSQFVGISLSVGLLLVYGVALYQGNENWRNASFVTERIISQVKQLHPVLEKDSHLFFVNLPSRLRRAFVFITGIEPAMQLAFDDPTLSASNSERFPVLTKDLGRTYFFEYDGQRVMERGDLVDQIRNRQTCEGDKAIGWEFEQEAQGWEPWNDIVAFGVQDGLLELRANGSDPILGSPLLEMDARPRHTVRVTMSVRTPSATPTGSLYWQTLDMADFSPAAVKDFGIIADGMMHVYDVPIDMGLGQRGPLVRLRLDPLDAIGDIQIDSIQVNCY